MKNFKYRLADFSDKQLLQEIESGKRSRPSQPLNDFEINEVIAFMESHGCIAIKLKTGNVKTDDPKFMMSTVQHYASRKLGVMVANGYNPMAEIAAAMAHVSTLPKNQKN